MSIVISFVSGAAALAVYQIARAMKRGASLKEAARNVISGGGGPGSGELPK